VQFGTRFISGAPLVAIGDSFTQGAGASDVTHSYISRLAAYLNSTLVNLSVSGTGTDEGAKALLGHFQINRRYNLTILSGFNDVGSYGISALNKITCNHRAMIAASFLREAHPASTAPRRVGNWTPLGTSIGGVAQTAGGTGMFTDDGPTSYLEFDVFGETIVIGGYTQIATGMYQDFNVSIDGADPIVFDGLGMNIMPYPAVGFNAMVLKNQGFSNHTVRISPIADPHTVLDYVGSLIDPAAAVGCLIGSIPTRTNWSEHGFTSNQSTMDAVSAAIAGVVEEFAGWPVSLIPIDDFYHSVYSDGYHPSDGGHLEIFNAFKSNVSLWRC
jgi:hypothetical protein